MACRTFGETGSVELLAMARSFPTLFIGIVAAGAAAGQQMVEVPAGDFEVTDQITTLRIRVSVSKFQIGATEVTQREFREILSSNPSAYPAADHPVENVSWWDAIRFCNRRSQKENLTPCYDETTGRRDISCTGYRLPTEAEWRIAAGPLPPEGERSKTGRLGPASTKTAAVLTEALKIGTANVRSFTPNHLGLYDMYGNVWEWCDDFFDVRNSPDSVRNPAGPPSGIARVIRGGSFVSSNSRWSRDYRSSMSPNSRSPFTGFRVARSIPSVPTPTITSASFFARYQNAPSGFASSTGPLSPVLAPNSSLETWKQTSAVLRAKWERLLQPPKTTETVRTRMVREVAQRNFSGKILELEMEPDIWEKVYVLSPGDAGRRKLPVMIVPFYDVDTPAAADLGGRNFDPAKGVNAFAYTAAQHGYLAVAVRWFGESYGESYSEAVANLARRHPESTGLGKWVADARKVCDFIATLAEADSQRIGIIGHSLGGKMALYAAALEPRIQVAVASELGIGFPFSNYDDYWYWGDRLSQLPKGMDQHELVALLAPRPFLLIGGDEYDKNESWHYINAARPVYRLLGQPDNIGYFNHHTGHTPSPDSVVAAFDWLDYFLKP